MKKFVIVVFLSLGILSLESCYTTKYVDYWVSIQGDLNKIYYGKTKSFIIENYPYPPTDIKCLDDKYEILVFERYRNYYVGNGITRFYLRDGECYKIVTNEYKLEKRLERVSIFE